MTSCSPCGMLPSTPRACAGAPERSTPEPHRRLMMNGTDSNGVTLEALVDWLSHFRDKVTEQRSYLTELDSAIGDADHGANMARGMAAVMDKIGAAPAGAVDELF